MLKVLRLNSSMYENKIVKEWDKTAPSFLKVRNCDLFK